MANVYESYKLLLRKKKLFLADDRCFLLQRAAIARGDGIDGQEWRAVQIAQFATHPRQGQGHHPPAQREEEEGTRGGEAQKGETLAISYTT